MKRILSKRLLVIFMCFVLCLFSFPVHVMGEGSRTITVSNPEFGEIFIDGMNENGRTVTVPSGHAAEIGVVPAHGYEIESVTIGSSTYSTDEEIGNRRDFSRSVEVNEDINVSVVFRPFMHTVTTNVGSNGSISPMNPEVEHGSDVTFTITPNAGYMINSLTVDGNQEHVNEHNQITLFNIRNDRMMSVDFKEAVTYTITTISGANGSVTPNNPKVPAGSDVTFTITPEPGYIIDWLRVDGRPEMINEHNQFTVFNVQRDMTLEVAFMQVIEHTITIPKPENGSVQIIGEGGHIPEGGSVITRNTGERVSYLITTGTTANTYYSISNIILQTEDGEEIDVTFDYYYDEVLKQIRIDVETMFNYTLKIDFKKGLEESWLSILSGEAISDNLIKEAVKRELGLKGLSVETDNMNILSRESFISANNVGYEVIEVATGSGSYVFYTVDTYTEMVVETFYKDGNATKSQIIIVDGNRPFSNDVQVEIHNDPSLIGVFGPYGAKVTGVFSNDNSIRLKHEYGNVFRVRNNYRIFQLHVVNKGRQSDNELNWFPMTLITDDALCMQVQAVSETGTQETFAWDLETFTHMTSDNATHKVFFGNDRVIIEKPRDNIGNTASMRTAPSNSPGYTFKNNSDGTVTIDFLSDYYDKVAVPLMITLQSGGTVQRTLTIHRVGVDIQAHNGADGNPSQNRNVWHGTQTGNQVNLSNGNQYIITASYYIPDYRDTLPHGLYVTRKYADGRIETQIITQPMTNPHPWQAEQFDPAKKMYLYNDGSSGWANVADYLIYSGPDAASAPVEISVLVLKNTPAEGGTFGGINYGSGTGVKWTKP